MVDDFHPSCQIDITYPSSHEVVSLGNKIDPAHTQEAPVVNLACSPTASKNESYTVILTDPDAPSRKNPKWAEMCHWIATLPSSDGSDEQGEIVEYKPPGPPPKTGYHRYVFLALSGDNNNVTAPDDRQHWGTGKKRHGVRDWAKTEGLKVVGANFFYAKNTKQ